MCSILQTFNLSHSSPGPDASSAMWTAFTCMLFSALVFLSISYVSSSHRTLLFNYLSSLIVSVSALAYLVMALGNSEIINGTCSREFLWVRYADWAVTGPLTIIVLAFIAGADYADIFFLVACSLIYTASFFAGATSSGWNATWPLFTFGLVASLPIIFTTLGRWAALAAAKGASVYWLYVKLAWLSATAWVGYVLVWATGDGSQSSSFDQETVAYAAVDIYARCVFCFVLIFSHDALEDSDDSGVNSKFDAQLAAVA